MLYRSKAQKFNSTKFYLDNWVDSVLKVQGIRYNFSKSTFIQ